MVETTLSSKFAWVSVFSSGNLSLKHVDMNFPKLSIVCCVSGMYEKSHYIFYRNLLKSTDLINLENACEYFAIKSLMVVGQFLRWTLFDASNIFDASKYSFEILVFCNHILSVLMTVPLHRRGTLDYLLIWTCGDMILFSHGRRQ